MTDPKKEMTFRLADEKLVAELYANQKLAEPEVLEKILQGEAKKDVRMKEVILNFRADLAKAELNTEQLNGIMKVLLDQPMRGDNWSG